MKLDLEDIAMRVLKLSLRAGNPRALVGEELYAFELAAIAFAHMPTCPLCKQQTGATRGCAVCDAQRKLTGDDCDDILPGGLS